MPKAIKLEAAFNEALNAFPYSSLKSYGISEGSLNPNRNSDTEYREAFGFIAGEIIGEPVCAEGEIMLEQLDNDIHISCWFKLFRGEGNTAPEILPAHLLLWGCYDSYAASSKQWRFWYSR